MFKKATNHDTKVSIFWNLAALYYQAIISYYLPDDKCKHHDSRLVF